MRLFLIVLGWLVLSVSAFSQINLDLIPVFGFSYEIPPNSNYPQITSVDAGSPAFFAELERGDQLISINQKSCRNLSIDSIHQLLSGKSLFAINLQIRTSAGDEKSVSLSKAWLLQTSYSFFRFKIFLNDRFAPLRHTDGECLFGDCYNGMGYYAASDSEAFYGSFENGHFTEGLYYYKQYGKPNFYLGTLKNNSFHGNGLHSYYSNGRKLIYQGEYLNGQADGLGVLIDGDSNLLYSGSFRGGMFHGKGKGLDDLGDFRDGQWSYNYFCGALPDERNLFYYENDPDLNHQLKRASAMLYAMSLSDSVRRVILKQSLNKYFAGKPSTSSTSTTTASSSAVNLDAIDQAANEFYNLQNNIGKHLVESFDTYFDAYQPANCFTSCSEYPRNIWIIVESGIPNLMLSDLQFVYVGRPEFDEEQEFFPFKFSFSENGLDYYHCGMYVEEIHSGCTYRWSLSTTDTKRHRCKTMVFTPK